VPAYCAGVLAGQFEANSKPPFLLWEYSTYVLAQKRTCTEMVLRWHEKRRADGITKGWDSEAALKVWRKPLREWFENPQEGHEFWLRRFVQWRAAAGSSFKYYMGKRCRDVEHPDPVIAKAAFAGAVENLSGIPEVLLLDILRHIGAGGRRAKSAYHKNAGDPKTATCKCLELDTWLLEIWPLVTHYDWTYHDVWMVANRKFNTPEESPFEKSAQMRDRCKDALGLRLSEMARRSSGRPPEPRESHVVTLPSLHALASGIVSIGEAPGDWIRGEVLRPGRQSD